MNIRIGDKVRFITEKLEGKVTGIVDETTVNVYCDEYGFDIPASVNDLVAIRSDFNTSDSSRSDAHSSATKTDHSERKISDTLYIAFIPDDMNRLTDTGFELFLVNDTPQTVLFSVGFYDGENHRGISAGNCNPNSTASLGSYKLKEIDRDIKSIHIQSIFFRKGKTMPRPAIDVAIKIQATNLCKAGNYKKYEWFSSIAYLKPLQREQNITREEIDETQLQTAVREKARAEHKIERPDPKSPNSNILEIDLHATELLETTAGMDNKDILEYQLDVFRKTLEENKLRKGKKIVFIHGKGDGVLRQRILWELQTRYKRFHHQDASFKQYGYGATMVTVK